MPINKQKTTMLQIAVPKSVASAWQDVVKISGNTQGELFSVMFAGFLSMCQRKGEEQNGKNKKDIKKKAIS